MQMRKYKILYLIGIAIIIIISYIAGELSVSNVDAKISTSSIQLIQLQDTHSLISQNEITNQSWEKSSEQADINLNRVIPVVGVLISSLIFCIILAKKNGLFFFKKNINL